MSTAPDAAWENLEFRVAAMSLILKCADMNSAGRPAPVAGMWTRAVYREFFRQADLENDMGLPLTPVFQRADVVISSAQVSSATALPAAFGHTVGHCFELPTASMHAPQGCYFL